MLEIYQFINDYVAGFLVLLLVLHDPALLVCLLLRVPAPGENLGSTTHLSSFKILQTE